MIRNSILLVSALLLLAHPFSQQVCAQANQRATVRDPLGQTTSSNETAPPRAFQIIDLGPGNVLHLTNSGMALYGAPPTTPGAIESYWRWNAGQAVELTSLITEEAVDMDEAGTVIGTVRLDGKSPKTPAGSASSVPFDTKTAALKIWPLNGGAATIPGGDFGFHVKFKYPRGCDSDIDVEDIGVARGCSAVSIDNGSYYGYALTGYDDHIRFDQGSNTYNSSWAVIVDGFAGLPTSPLGTAALVRMENANALATWTATGTKAAVTKARNNVVWSSVGTMLSNNQGDILANQYVGPYLNATPYFGKTGVALNNSGVLLAYEDAANSRPYFMINELAGTVVSIPPVAAGTAAIDFDMIGSNYRKRPVKDANGNVQLVVSPQYFGRKNMGAANIFWEEDIANPSKLISYSLNSFKLAQSNFQMDSISEINDNGIIACVGIKLRNNDGTPLPVEERVGHALLLVPVEIKDIKGDGEEDDQVIATMQQVPTQNQDEPDNDFDRRRNAYFQQAVVDQSIAYIDPHRAANNSPDMPRLVAQIPGGQPNLPVRWRLEVSYLRGNGYRAYYVKDFTRPEDTVFIPARDGQGSPTFTPPMAANQEWRIFESADWIAELQRGLFGGTAKLYMWPVGQDVPENPVITFRIGGRNPDPTLARQYIDQIAGAQFWYAYAIARHETFGRIRANGQIRYYNQFYTDFQGGPIGDASRDMGWAAWARSWPLYNLDRGPDPQNPRLLKQNGAGGYGVFQLTWGPRLPTDPEGTGVNAFIPRDLIWNWRTNSANAITELQGKLAAATELENALHAGYPAWPALPNRGQLTGREAIVATLYNGTSGIRPTMVNGRSRYTPWVPVMSGQSRTWQFRENVNEYVLNVNARINTTMP